LETGQLSLLVSVPAYPNLLPKKCFVVDNGISASNGGSRLKQELKPRLVIKNKMIKEHTNHSAEI
jgi:hypothetical protein